MILRSNGSLGRGKPPNALRAKGVEKEEDVNNFMDALSVQFSTGVNLIELTP
jgi:hypothetical protein